MLSFYADESGSMGRGQGDWVALLAIGFHDDNWKSLKDSVDALKRRYFHNWNLDVTKESSHRGKMKTGTPFARSPGLTIAYQGRCRRVKEERG